MILPSTVDTESAQGAVVAAALQSAVAALEFVGQDSVVVETATGNVTVVKLARSNNVDPSAPFVFQFADGGGQTSGDAAVVVSVPLSLVSQLESEGNVILTMAQMDQELTDSIPKSSAGDGKVVINGPVIEISLIKENLGQVEIANVSGLAEPMIFRLQSASPVQGDYCTSFDLATNSWSSSGMSLVDASTVAQQLPGMPTNGTWCMTTHLSIFSLAQDVLFNETFEAKDIVLSVTRYPLSIGIVAATFVLVCCMFGLWSLRRLRTPAGGKTKIQDDKGKLHVVSFVRSEVVAEEMMTPRSTKSSQKDATKGKVLVTWDVEPERFMPKLDHLRGHRWVAMDLDAAPVKEKKSLPSLSREPSRELLRKASHQVEPEIAIKVESQPSEDVDDSDLMGPAGSWEFNDEELVEVSLDWPDWDSMHGSLHEVYKDRAPVLYWSATHQRLLQAFISGTAFFDEQEMPHYDVHVGPRRQLRRQLPCHQLRPHYRDGEPAYYLKESNSGGPAEDGEEKRKWRKAFIAQSIPTKATIQLLDVEELEEGGESELVTDIPLDRVCRRFENGASILAYAGYETGWVPAVIESVEKGSERSPDTIDTLQVLFPLFVHGTDLVDFPVYFIQDMQGPTLEGNQSNIHL